MTRQKSSGSKHEQTKIEKADIFYSFLSTVLQFIIFLQIFFVFVSCRLFLIAICRLDGLLSLCILYVYFPIFIPSSVIPRIPLTFALSLFSFCFPFALLPQVVIRISFASVFYLSALSFFQIFNCFSSSWPHQKIVKIPFNFCILLRFGFSHYSSINCH